MMRPASGLGITGPMRLTPRPPVKCRHCRVKITDPVWKQRICGKPACKKADKRRRDRMASSAKAAKAERASWAKVKNTRPVRDRKYRAWIRTQPCIVPNCLCKAPSSPLESWHRKVECCHQGDHGQAQKAPDDRAFPMCRWMHLLARDAYHNKARGWFERHGIDIEKEVLRLRERYAREVLKRAA